LNRYLANQTKRVVLEFFETLTDNISMSKEEIARDLRLANVDTDRA
jgi:hypothetical protein